MTGNVEVDETYVGGKKKPGLPGRGAVGKAVVAGAKQRGTGKVVARVVPNTRKQTLHAFIAEHVDPSANVYTDELRSYTGIPNPHHTVNHGAREYVRDMAHTNGIESFWSMLKRAYDGTFHWFRHKHLDRYVTEFASRHNIRDMDTVDQMTHLAAGMIGKWLTYQNLTK